MEGMNRDKKNYKHNDDDYFKKVQDSFIDTIFDDLNKKQSNFAKKVVLSGKNEQFLLHFDQNSHLVDNLNIVISNGASAKVALIYQSKNQIFQ